MLRNRWKSISQNRHLTDAHSQQECEQVCKRELEKSRSRDKRVPHSFAHFANEWDRLRFRLFHFLDQRRHNIKQISHHRIVRDLKNRRLGIFVDRHDDRHPGGLGVAACHAWITLTATRAPVSRSTPA